MPTILKMLVIIYTQSQKAEIYFISVAMSCNQLIVEFYNCWFATMTKRFLDRPKITFLDRPR
jgi:hypothetical protein